MGGRREMATASAVPVPASHLDVARDAEPATRAANAAMAARLPFAEQSDFEAAKRGLIAPVPEGMVKSASGTVLWNLGEYAFIDGELAPATVNPSLWRMARLNMANGLFKVTDRLYQLRGFDIANMTVIEGDTGLILIDPLTTAEVARAGARALLHAPAEEAGGRGDLHPQPRRPLRRRARRDRRGRRQGGQGRRSSRPTASWRRCRARTCWPACRWGAARSSSSAPCCRAARAARSMPAWARASPAARPA